MALAKFYFVSYENVSEFSIPIIYFPRLYEPLEHAIVHGESVMLTHFSCPVDPILLPVIQLAHTWHTSSSKFVRFRWGGSIGRDVIICMYVCMYVFMYVCMYVYIYVYMCVCK